MEVVAVGAPFSEHGGAPVGQACASQGTEAKTEPPEFWRIRLPWTFFIGAQGMVQPS